MNDLTIMCTYMLHPLLRINSPLLSSKVLGEQEDCRINPLFFFLKKEAILMIRTHLSLAFLPPFPIPPQNLHIQRRSFSYRRRKRRRSWWYESPYITKSRTLNSGIGDEERLIPRPGSLLRSRLPQKDALHVAGKGHGGWFYGGI